MAHFSRWAPVAGGILASLPISDALKGRKSLRCEAKQSLPVVVLGGGVMGLSTAWSLCRRGVKVELLDANHSEKGSWGETRIARVSYADPVMLRLARRSYELYEELKKEHREPLMCPTGCLDVGFDRRSLDGLAKTYEELGQSYERLSHRQVAERWPMLRLSDDYVEASVFCPAGDAVLASVVMGLPLLPLVTSVEQQTYYATPEGTEELFSAGKLPVVLEHNPSPEPEMKRRGGYMIPHVSNGVDGVKFGMHRQGPLMDHEDFPMVPGAFAAAQRYFACAGTRAERLWSQRWPEEEDSHLREETDAFARRILPDLSIDAWDRTDAFWLGDDTNKIGPNHGGLKAEDCHKPLNCPNWQDFVVGVHPEDPDIIVVCGFAGEGFKFGPAIGEMAATLVTGGSFAVPESVQRFRLNRPSLLLLSHNIDPNQFGVGKAKDIEQLAKEVETGASRLMLDAQQHKKLVRVVDIVVLKLRPADGSRLLVEFKEKFADQREREIDRLPGTKKDLTGERRQRRPRDRGEPHENARPTAERILREMMNMDPSMVTFDFSTVERQEEETDSPSFPGVTTVYRKELVECKVTTSEQATPGPVGLPGMTQWHATDPQGNTKFFTWLTDSEAEARKVKLKVHGSHISTLVRAPIGLDEEALREYLKTNGIDVTRFGQDGTKSLKEFSSELIKGETRLLQVPGGGILVITEVVMLILTNAETNETLIQTGQVWPDGKSSNQARIPGAKRRPDENQFLCARRILKRQLEIDENAVRISQDVGYLEEDRGSRSYPGLKTVYRKRVIKGEIVPGV
eukprot:g29102.t1